MNKIVFCLSMLFIAKICLSAFAGGNGMEGTPYQVSTLNDLQDVANYPNSFFVQINNIDATPTSGWNGGDGFVAIGTGTEPFSGNYNGDGYAINGLTIDRSSELTQGLFGYVTNGAISNIVLTSADVTGASYTGSLLGYGSNVTVTGCSCDGSVHGNVYTGTLIGYLGGVCEISMCCCSGNVTANEMSGGLIGFSQADVVVADCFSTADVITAQAPAIIGGLIGYSSSYIQNCYSTGNVTTTTNSGGLLGMSTGSVEACFWDLGTSGHATSADGIGLPTDEMKENATYLDAGWNSNNWRIDPEQIINDGYPFLSWQDPYGGETLPVTMSSFTATTTSMNYAQINWTTQSESDLVGYHILRGESNDLDLAQTITASIIPGTNTTTEARYEYVDRDVEMDATYFYWLQSVELDGGNELFGPVSVTIAEGEEQDDTPDVSFVTAFSSVYPNPFNPMTTISYSLTKDGMVSFTMFNLKGRKVGETTVHGHEGSNTLTWNAEDLPSGLYFIRMNTDGLQETRKVMLLK